MTMLRQRGEVSGGKRVVGLAGRHCHALQAGWMGLWPDVPLLRHLKPLLHIDLAKAHRLPDPSRGKRQ